MNAIPLRTDAMELSKEPRAGELRAPRIALVAHDNRKATLVQWAIDHVASLSECELFGTGTTGGLVSKATGLPVHRYLSGPQGGDLQIGAAIAEAQLDALIFFWDPLTAQPHDPDVRALLRIAVVWDVPVACNQATADLLVQNPAFLARRTSKKRQLIAGHEAISDAG